MRAVCIIYEDYDAESIIKLLQGGNGLTQKNWLISLNSTEKLLNLVLIEFNDLDDSTILNLVGNFFFCCINDYTWLQIRQFKNCCIVPDDCCNLINSPSNYCHELLRDILVSLSDTMTYENAVKFTELIQGF